MKTTTSDNILDLYLMVISIGLNAFSFFGIMDFESVIPKILIASFGASLVLLQVNTLRKWKSTKRVPLFVTYVICTFFSLLSTCYLITTLTLGKSLETDLGISKVNSKIESYNGSIEDLKQANSDIRNTNNLLNEGISRINQDKEFYGDNFYTLKKQANSQIAEKEQAIADNNAILLLNNSKIREVNDDINILRDSLTQLKSNKGSDGFHKLSEALSIPYTALILVSFLLLAAVLELGIFILTPPLGNFSKKEEHSVVQDLLGKLEVAELELKALEKTSTVPQRPTIDKYIDALFSSGTKKLVKKDDVARITGYNANVCDDFYIKLTNKVGSKGTPFVEKARGRGTFSLYTKQEIKNELKSSFSKTRK